MRTRLSRYFILLITTLAFSLSSLAQRARMNSAIVAPDSVAAPALTTSTDTTLTSISDSLSSDTTQKKRDDLEAPVIYQSQDSMVWYKNGNAYLYGSGQVNYQKIELKANEITIDLETSTVYAQGTTDSVGTVTGRPIFADGDTPYESETMSYNFKSRKGFITLSFVDADAFETIFCKRGRMTD